MELRSSRSRSRTPFITSTYESEINEDQAGHTVIRTTRSTTKITSSNFDNFGTTNNNFDSTPLKSMKTRSSKSEKIVRRSRYKTSDYSSEDGETQISTSLQNANNHLLEDSRDSSSRSTGSVSAIDYYRAAGDYWNKYPKTDYTYSLHSRDKTEIAPGVVAMPNMSRRSLHGGDSSNEFILAHKHTNTEEDIQYTPYPYNGNNENFVRTRRTNLFANNNNAKYKSMLSQDVYVKKTFRSRISNFFLTIFTWISSAFYYMYSTQNSILITFGKLMHKLATRFMLWDTWLLRSLKNKNKVTSLLAVCLIPLLLFGGWWLLSQLGSLLAKTQNHAVHENSDQVVIEKIKESIVLEAPKTDQTAVKLSSNQLEEIANLVRLKLDLENSDAIAQKIIESPNVQNLINSYKLSKLEDADAEGVLRRQQGVVDALRIEIDKVRLELLQLEKIHNKDIAGLVAQLRSEHEQNMATLSVKINRCCRTSVLQMENYISNILKDIFQAPGNLRTYKDISRWIRSVFVAKEDLETRLMNVTQSLESNFDNLIKNNGDVIMGEVMSRVSAELNQRINRAQVYTEGTNVNIDPITDERIKNIVEQTLMIYDADKTGLVDYALESAGGEIITTHCTESYKARTAVLSIFGIPIWYPTISPRTVITPGVVPGECWAFQEFPGILVIKLSARVKIDRFSYEHISKLIASNGNINSAPKEFFVYGLQNETDSEPILLGQYFYDYDKPPLQFFDSNVHDLAFNIVELKVVSNHGNPSYTCLYRFRVHGRLDTTPS